MKPTYSISDNGVATSTRTRKRLSESLVPVRRESKVSYSAIAQIDFDATPVERIPSPELLQEHVTALEMARENTNLAKADLQQFVNAVSHDLRTPLRAITGFSELLTQEYSDRLDDNGKDYINRIVDGTVRIQKLINCVTELSRICSKEPEFVDVDLNEVVENVMDDLHQSIDESNAVLTWESLPTVSGDPVQLLQLFRHLIENSIRFDNDVAPQIHISCESSETGCLVKVCDNGIGIAKKDQENAFKMFRRIGIQERGSMGLGAGLTICRKIVERHSGQIGLESEPGAGTKVIFSIASPNESR